MIVNVSVFVLHLYKNIIKMQKTILFSKPLLYFISPAQIQIMNCIGEHQTRRKVRGLLHPNHPSHRISPIITVWRYIAHPTEAYHQSKKLDHKHHRTHYRRPHLSILPTHPKSLVNCAGSWALCINSARIRAMNAASAFVHSSFHWWFVLIRILLLLHFGQIVQSSTIIADWFGFLVSIR